MKSTSLRNAMRMLLPIVVGAAAFATPQLSAADDDDSVATSFDQAEQKFKKLKKRVKQLETDVGELQALNLPVEVDVDCGAGGTIGNVLAMHARGLGRLTIRVSGTCAEQVNIARSNVSIEGQTGAAIQLPANGGYGFIVPNGVQDVSVSSFTITGGTGAAVVNKSSYGRFSNIVAQGSTFGMVAADGGTIEVTASTMRNNTFGSYAVRGGVAIISNSTIENNPTGVMAMKNGTINLTSILPDGTLGNGVVVRNNGTGGVARSGGLLDLTNARIENNTSVGLLADSGSAVHLFVPFGGPGNTISGNGTAGILVQKNASVVFADATNTVTGNGFGVLCQNNPSYIVSAAGPGNISGNTSGNIVGCTP